ncbi:energy-coupling factor transporter transmembrane component T family protein [Brevibacterium spongiae]|uniref:Energy-coupling factor transporter transmembrane protein EcfT n=1 Tax=Brevibacterium spongiae TaxID=2909672 RepID=A0ABY5SWN1_9MICO|nr:energy-coupling factor transporter transmembrane component T [Brevibacterium spongiae]UVI37501.1 energy-coupling factor transporter transmembrane protein EcfT [Brevibacterium spongiae]
MSSASPDSGLRDLEASTVEADRTSSRLHPATELVILACGLLLIFGLPSPIVPAAVLTGTIVTVVNSRTVRLRSWSLAVGILCLPTLLVLIIVQGLFYPGVEVHVLWEAGPARLSVEGLSIAVQIWLRVSALIGLCALFGLGADSARLFDGLRRLRLPAGLAYVCASAIGLIPLIGARTREIIDARKARGWATDRWTVRMRLLPGIVVGLITAILITVDQRHDVLEQSGLNMGPTTASLQDHRDGTGQRVLRILTPLVTLGLIAASVAGLLPLPETSHLIGGA